MKLAFVSANKGLAWGGSEELWAAAAGRALERGHRVCIYVFAWSEPARQVLALRDRGAKLIPIPLSRPKLAFFGPRHPWLRELAAFGPQVVCISQGQEYDLAGRRWGPAMIDWLRSSGTPAASVVQYNDDDARPGPRAADAAREFVELAGLNAYVARRNLEQTERALGINVPRAAIVRNPVNLADTSPLPWPGEGAASFACVARLHAQTKGHDLLLAALARPEWRDREWRLSLFGAGPDERVFREMAGALDIAERVEFRGFASDLRALWAEHHALVLPSRGEGTPLAMVEAMLLARPCLVTDVGDCAAWVREGSEGWVAASPSVELIAGALERAWQNRGRWQTMGNAGAKRAREMFDPDAGGTLLEMLVKLGQNRGAIAEGRS